MMEPSALLEGRSGPLTCDITETPITPASPCPRRPSGFTAQVIDLSSRMWSVKEGGRRGPVGVGRGASSLQSVTRRFSLALLLGYVGVGFKAPARKSMFHRQKEKSKPELRFQALIIPANS